MIGELEALCSKVGGLYLWASVLGVFDGLAAATVRCGLGELQLGSATTMRVCQAGR